MRLVSGTAAVLVAASLSGAAWASPVSARVSTQGLKLIETQIKGLIPSHIDLAPITVSLSDTACPEGPITFTQEDTRIDLALESFSLQSLPGKLRADLVVTVAGTGKAHFERVYACFGRETCDEAVGLERAHITIDLQASVDAAGRPHVTVTAPVLDVTPDNLSFSISGCAEAGIVDTLYGVVEKVGLSLGAKIGQDLIEKKVGPALEGILAGSLAYQGSAAFLGYRAQLTRVDFSADGITVAGDLDLTSVFPAASCLARDPGEPAAVAGAAPDLSAGAATDLAVSVNLGVVQDAIYHVWREGLLCITPDTLKTLAIDLGALEQLGRILPGFPAGTIWAVEASVGLPPLVEGSPANAARLAVHAGQVALDIIATLPDRSVRRLHVDLDATVSAQMIVDPASNALAMSVDGAKIERLVIDDRLGLAAAGIDLEQLKALVESTILPGALAGIGRIPISGPVFGGLAGAYVVLKELRTTPAYLVAKANLFIAPAADHDAPTTQIVDRPARAVRPADARLTLGGADAQIPADLLAYRVTVDGKAAAPTFVRTLLVGEVGKSGTVRVEVHAIDLAGNEDRAGATADVQVDGVAPTITVRDSLRGSIGDLAPTVHFVTADDRTAAGAIALHVRVLDLGAAGGTVEDRDLAAGAREATLTGLTAGRSYKAILTARDEVGNLSSAEMIFAVAADASGGGCAFGGGPGGLGALLLAAAALAASRSGRGSASSRPTAARRRRCTGSSR
jgi:hypothetical protein